MVATLVIYDSKFADLMKVIQKSNFNGGLTMKAKTKKRVKDVMNNIKKGAGVALNGAAYGPDIVTGSVGSSLCILGDGLILAGAIVKKTGSGVLRMSKSQTLKNHGINNNIAIPNPFANIINFAKS